MLTKAERERIRRWCNEGATIDLTGNGLVSRALDTIDELEKALTDISKCKDVALSTLAKLEGTR